MSKKNANQKIRTIFTAVAFIAFQLAFLINLINVFVRAFVTSHSLLLLVGIGYAVAIIAIDAAYKFRLCVIAFLFYEILIFKSKLK